MRIYIYGVRHSVDRLKLSWAWQISHVMRIIRVLIENHINFKAVGDAWNIGTD